VDQQHVAAMDKIDVDLDNACCACHEAFRND
jgi:hypothetical protein